MTPSLEEVKRMERYEAPSLISLGSFQGHTLEDIVIKSGPGTDLLSDLLQLEGSSIEIIDN